MAYLSSYLSRPRGASAGRGTGSYSYPRRYTPSSVARRGVGPREQQASPYQGQDLASALLQQRMVSKSAAPSSRFESTYDYDPILSKIQALSSQSVANAKTDAGQLRNQALIQSGGYETGKDLGFDTNTLAASQQNPESEYAILQRDFAQRQQDLIEAMNSQNLLYSGEYTHNLSDLMQGRASAEAGIGSRLREMLSGIDSGVLGAEESARQEALAAAQDAALARSFIESNFTPGDLNDFVYGSTLPPGYSDEQLMAQAVAQAPAGAVPMHIMNQGMVQDGQYSIKYKMPDGTTNTIWIPLPSLTPPKTSPTPWAGSTPEEQAINIAKQAALTHNFGTPASTDTGVVNPLDTYLGGGLGVS